MTDYIRRLVSGDKARFKDGNLDLDLDLVYITDHVIIMGYPASGLEGLYRNRRENVKKFLEHRHGQNFWVFNFCPIRENSYPGSVFDGRVSRYPFPDHHAPPLAILPLAAREIRDWLDGSADRVAVLHCKAGKGRSGTVACSYLLSLDDNPTPPRLERSYNAKQWRRMQADKVIEAIPDDYAIENAVDSAAIDDAVLPPDQSEAPASVKPFKESLKGVLDLHTSRRMKASSSEKIKRGVSIPSQRRWLYYWSLLLAHEAPPHLWELPSADNGPESKPHPKVRLTEVKLRMKKFSRMQIQLVRVASLLIGRTKQPSARQNGHRHVWASIARYDDELVETLEKWEKNTREVGEVKRNMGKRKDGGGGMESKELAAIFEDGRWDTEKMIRSFGKLGIAESSPVADKNEKIITYTLRPLANEKGDAVQNDRGIILDAEREVRVKLFMGQVFMGWIWFIPTFHMDSTLTHLTFTRKEVDFSIGIGGWIVDIGVSLEWDRDVDVVGSHAEQ